VKRICLLLVLLPTLITAARRLEDFDALYQALTGGDAVRVVVDYADCEMLIDNEPVGAGPVAVGGMPVGAFEYFGREVVGNDRAYISFGHSQLIAHRDYVLNYVRFRVYEDGEVEITARYLDPQTHEELMDEAFFTTVDGAAAFYVKD
jgi:hypothetical protein